MKLGRVKGVQYYFFKDPKKDKFDKLKEENFKIPELTNFLFHKICFEN